MKHYEIVLLTTIRNNINIHLVLNTIKKIIDESLGKIYRLENWGYRYLAYPIKKQNRANYILINIYCKINIMKKIRLYLLLHKIIMRVLILNVKKAITSHSKFILQNKLT